MPIAISSSGHARSALPSTTTSARLLHLHQEWREDSKHHRESALAKNLELCPMCLTVGLVSRDQSLCFSFEHSKYIHDMRDDGTSRCLRHFLIESSSRASNAFTSHEIDPDRIPFMRFKFEGINSQLSQKLTLLFMGTSVQIQNSCLSGGVRVRAFVYSSTKYMTNSSSWSPVIISWVCSSLRSQDHFWAWFLTGAQTKKCTKLFSSSHFRAEQGHKGPCTRMTRPTGRSGIGRFDHSRSRESGFKVRGLLKVHVT